MVRFFCFEVPVEQRVDDVGFRGGFDFLCDEGKGAIFWVQVPTLDPCLFEVFVEKKGSCGRGCLLLQCEVTGVVVVSGDESCQTTVQGSTGYG